MPPYIRAPRSLLRHYLLSPSSDELAPQEKLILLAIYAMSGAHGHIIDTADSVGLSAVEALLTLTGLTPMDFCAAGASLHRQGLISELGPLLIATPPFHPVSRLDWAAALVDPPSIEVDR